MSKPLKRIPRNPEKFETIDLFQAFMSRQNLKLPDEKTEKDFVQKITDEIRANKANPIVIHGRRIESMFGYVLASLGKCLTIKKEDSGDVYAVDTEIQPPDYRIILDNGYECFIEVKNHRPKDPIDPYYFRKSDLESLAKYASVFKKDLKIAIYWSQWNIWTLTAADDIDINTEKPMIDLPKAMQLNEMSLIGDLSIATTPPLTWRLLPNHRKPITVKDSELHFTIGGVELYCGNTLIQDPSEKNLALYLMFFGKWIATEPIARTKDNILEAADIVANPENRTQKQQFEFVGELSSMISRFYDFLTASEKTIERLQPFCEPGTLGVVIPEKCKYLKLWRFTLHKSNPPKP